MTWTSKRELRRQLEQTEDDLAALRAAVAELPAHLRAVGGEHRETSSARIRRSTFNTSAAIVRDRIKPLIGPRDRPEFLRLVGASTPN